MDWLGIHKSDHAKTTCAPPVHEISSHSACFPRLCFDPCSTAGYAEIPYSISSLIQTPLGADFDNSERRVILTVVTIPNIDEVSKG